MCLGVTTTLQHVDHTDRAGKRRTGGEGAIQQEGENEREK